MAIRLLRSREPNYIRAGADPGHTYTWAGWFWFENLHPAGDWSNLSIRSSDQYNDLPEIEPHATDGSGRFSYWNNGAAGSVSDYILRPGYWVHIAVVRPGTSGTGTIYYNGSAVATNTMTSFTGANIAWGNNLVPGDNMTGRIAHLRLWTAALSESEIRAEMASVTVVRTTSLWGDWPLLDDADDESGNGRNLTVTGTAEYVSQPALSAIQFVGSGIWATTASASLAIPMPAGAQIGDVILLFIAIEQATTGRNVSSFGQDNAGWTSAVNVFSGTQAIQGRLYWNTIDGTAITATTTITATLSASDEYVATLLVFRGVDQVAPLLSITSAGPGTSGDAVADAKSGVDIADWVLFGAASAYGTTWTPPTNWAELQDARSGTGSTNISLAVCYRSDVTSTGADTYNAATNDYWVEWTAVLNRAGGDDPAAFAVELFARAHANLRR